MRADSWQRALRKCADPGRVRHFWKMLEATSAGAKLQSLSVEQARVLAALLSGSQALAGWLVAHPHWLATLEPENLKFPRRKQGLRKEASSLLAPALSARDYEEGLKRIREFKQRETLRIAARDLARLGPVPEITQELSDLADVCLGSVWQVCHQQLTERHGQPWHQEAQGGWQPTAGCLVGLGKLGGQELNYSSDVDVIFVYSEEGSVFKAAPGTGKAERPALTNHQFFNGLAKALVGAVVRLAPEGTLYRMDLRLRPEGEAGPLSRSLSSYENYYSQWGQTWERMMLIKARAVAGSEALGAEFLEMIQPFRYPRSINLGALREIATMKERIENEVVKAGELERNVKLGRGGIREIEFVAQALQLLHGGREPFLQSPQTLGSLQKLGRYGKLTAGECQALDAAYVFLREVEHRLQMEDNLQTHTIPLSHRAQERLARLMGCATVQKFESEHLKRRRAVRRTFDKVMRVAMPQSRSTARSPLVGGFAGAEGPWKAWLAQQGFRDVEAAFRMIREFVEGPGYVHVSPRTSELAQALLPRLFAQSKGRGERSGAAGQGAAGGGRKTRAQNRALALSDPDRVVTRLDSFISAYGARATLFELWNRNPSIFELLLLLFDRSEFLAELAIRKPDLVDELVTSGRLRQRKSAEETLRDLRLGSGDEDQYLWLRRYHQAELMRIGLRDILGLADFEQYLIELSALADACLQYALEVVMRKHTIKTPPIVIIGLGKLGGGEIDYGSDLDIIFVGNPTVRQSARLVPLAIEVMDLVSRRTEEGTVFHTDARLRPDGEKGLLVNALEAYESYYRQRAQLWEIQSLTRTRTVAGDMKLGERFQELAGTLTDFARPSLPLAAFTPRWKQKIHQMRMRIEKERTPPGKDELAIKTGRGGLMDAEFIAQAMCLENGWQEANTLRALERGRKAGVLPDAVKLVDHYRRLRSFEAILRRWSYEGETILPADRAEYYRLAVLCGFVTAEAFRQAVADAREAIRSVYLEAFQP